MPYPTRSRIKTGRRILLGDSKRHAPCAPPFYRLDGRVLHDPVVQSERDPRRTGWLRGGVFEGRDRALFAGVVVFDTGTYRERF
jgi:hypothetical protein